MNFQFSLRFYYPFSPKCPNITQVSCLPNVIFLAFMLLKSRVSWLLYLSHLSYVSTSSEKHREFYFSLELWPSVAYTSNSCCGSSSLFIVNFFHLYQINCLHLQLSCMKIVSTFSKEETFSAHFFDNWEFPSDQWCTVQTLVDNGSAPLPFST